MKYALISVFDKKNIVSFAKKLHSLDYLIISTGGTAKELTKNKIPVVPIEQITGNPESFDGRMKTISFQIESGLLFDRTKKSHVTEASKLQIPEIEIVVCNLYPFDRIVDHETEINKAVELVDVGGPTMLRAGAKNFKSVYAVCDPEDYNLVIEAISNKSKQDSLRQKLAAKVYSYLSWYDSHIASYLNDEELPQYFPMNGKKMSDLRYGDNPHQKASWYLRPFTNSPLKNLQKISGRDLSVTNLTDINAGIETVRFFEQPSAVVIKHNTPCGIALGKSPAEALSRAIDADPVSAFGGVIVLNKPIDTETAERVSDFKKNNRSHFDIIASPNISKTAQNTLSSIRKTTGIYVFGDIPKKRLPADQIRWVDGGYAIQTLENDDDIDSTSWKVVTKKKPNSKEMKQIETAWKFIARVKSNSIVIVDKSIPMTRGIGTGQTSRIGSAQIAIAQAGKHTEGGILASDGFLPFSDTVELAAKHKIGFVIQPGGSIQDEKSIKVADDAGMVMMFTGKRLFWH